jgi:hypothetical protein
MSIRRAAARHPNSGAYDNSTTEGRGFRSWDCHIFYDYCMHVDANNSLRVDSAVLFDFSAGPIGVRRGHAAGQRVPDEVGGGDVAIAG